MILEKELDKLVSFKFNYTNYIFDMSYEKELQKKREAGMVLGLLSKYASLDKESFEESEEKVAAFIKTAQEAHDPDGIIKEAIGRAAQNFGRRVLGKSHYVGPKDFNPRVADRVRKMDAAADKRSLDDAVDGEFGHTGNPLSSDVRRERFGGGLVGGGGNRGGGGGGGGLEPPWYGEGGKWYHLNRPGGGPSALSKGLMGLTALGGVGGGAYAYGNAGGQREGAEKAVNKFTNEYSNMTFLEKLMFFFKTMFSDQNKFREQLTDQVSPGLPGVAKGVA